jgi:hypothetical protein
LVYTTKKKYDALKFLVYHGVRRDDRNLLVWQKSPSMTAITSPVAVWTGLEEPEGQICFLLLNAPTKTCQILIAQSANIIFFLFAT